MAPVASVRAGRIDRAEPFPVETPLVRVGLMRFSTTGQITLSAEPGARLFGPKGRERAAGMGPWTITVSGAGALARDARGRRLGTAGTGTCWRLQGDGQETQIGIALSAGLPRHYRGGLEISASSGRLRVVNEVTLEDYLRGVVPGEMGSGSPLEALKAQAVASRTFMLYSLGRWTTDGYDVRDTTDSQVYGGVEAEMPDTDRAIRETAGLILTVAGHPFPALFCADCGGVTTPGAKPDDFPRSVSDADIPGLDMARVHPVWTLNYTPETLAALLDRSRPANAPRRVDNIEILEIDVSGRVRRLRITWRNRSRRDAAPSDDVALPEIPSLSPDDAETGNRHGGMSRRDRGPDPGATGNGQQATGKRELPTPCFQELRGNTLRTLLGLDTLRSTLFTVRRAPDGRFLIEGHGWGHGRGLCQAGAKAMAAPLGYDFRAILKHYYPGAALTPIDFPDDEEGTGNRQQATGKREQPAAGHSKPDTRYPIPDTPSSEVRNGR
jgi:stage II sporulation protein D